MNDFTCPICSNSPHKTTPAFDIDKPLRGDMFSLKQEHKDASWESFEEIESIVGDNLTCPVCGNCYADSFTGKIRK